MLILYVLLSFLHPDCFQTQPATTELSGTLSINKMNNNQVLTGNFDESSNEMIVWANGEIVTRVTQFNESYGVLINNNDVAAGLGSYGISQDSDYWMLEQTCVADLDNNGFRDVADIIILHDAWGQTDQDL
ncbi:MAG: hypothetical protein ACI9JK_001536 [Phycisphaerales bacterium]|jgi:hypothetical protein